MADTAPFYRMGEPFIIPVSPTSGNTAFPITMPRGATSFRVTNPNPFSVRLKGITAKQQAAGQTLVVTSTTGWLFMPGCVEIYGSVNPVAVAVISVNGPFAGSDAAQVAGTGVVELQYGTGA